jgi:hypothetical protein
MVQRSPKSQLLAACGRILEPLVRFLLKSGVSWKEFSELSKAKFVQVATTDFGIRGRPTNASRVAILTGLDRREVRKLRDSLADRGPEDVRFMTKASQVLDDWYHDARYRDASGQPRDLEFENSEACFAELVRRSAPGLPAVAMLKELKAAGAVAELATGLLRPLKRVYIPMEMSDEQLRLWGSTIRDLAATVGYNFTRPPKAVPMFERRALNLKVDPKHLHEFHAFLSKEGQEFLERIDDWLSAHTVSTENPEVSGIRIGAGVYQFQDKPGE